MTYIWQIYHILPGANLPALAQNSLSLIYPTLTRYTGRNINPSRPNARKVCQQYQFCGILENPRPDFVVH